MGVENELDNLEETVLIYEAALSEPPSGVLNFSHICALSPGHCTGNGR